MPPSTDGGEPTSINIDLDNGMWIDVYSVRHEAISLPEGSEVPIFDYPEHSDISISELNYENTKHENIIFQHQPSVAELAFLTHGSTGLFMKDSS